ncbi:MAG: LamG domain-containing protein [Gemmataceae bacterium]
MACRLATWSMLLLPLVAHADLTRWERPRPDFSQAKVDVQQATLQARPWTFLRAPGKHEHVQVEFTCRVLEPGTQAGFFGQWWSVWPDPTQGDQGYDVGLLLRAGEKSGYRVQLSHRYQDVALVRYPEGGFVRVVPCAVKKGQAHRVMVRLQANRVIVQVDGQEKIDYLDPLPPLEAGTVGLGTSSAARVQVEGVRLTPLAAAENQPIPAHAVQLSTRTWLGGRPWVFDGDEPILLLPVPESPSLNNAKLRPGRKPMLSWNGHWDIANQGAFPEGANQLSPVKVQGGGKTVTAAWSGKQVKGRFVTQTTLTVGFDPRRETYTYDIASELEVLPGVPFHFRYGYDFEHHTPLDPFRWQYLVMRKKGGRLVHRPVYPIDPGPQLDLETRNGLRVWYGRHLERMELAPAVEYQIEAGKRRLNTAVCAAFYDTGVSFEPETAEPGTKVRVKYRYTAYPAAEAEQLFRESTIYESPMLDPQHHYLFADDWPVLRFNRHVPLSETWIYGRRPFLSGHNQRPTYDLVRDAGAPSGWAMKLGPGAFGEATLATPPDLPGGRYVLLARVKSDNATGPGGRIEVSVTAPKTGKLLEKHTHYLGAGSFGWKQSGFALDVPPGAGLALGLGNAGTGEVLVGEVAFRKLATDEKLPEGVAAKANPNPPPLPSAPRGAIADYRMEEGKGLHVFNHARGPLGMLELGNVEWTRDQGRPALVFRDQAEGKGRFPRAGTLDRGYLSHEGYRGRDRVPVALAGFHGGAIPVEAFTLAAWINPADAMGRSVGNRGGDVIGFGARRIVLRLLGSRAPYQLSVALNVSEEFTAKESMVANRWHHVAVTGEPAGGKWLLRLYLNGKPIHEARTQKQAAPMTAPPSLVLGTELFYFHDSYYRGSMGRIMVFDRALSAAELAALAKD